MAYSLSEDEWRSVMKLGCRGTPDLKAFAADGIYRGGEEIVSRQLGNQYILPYAIEDIIAAGLEALSADRIKLLTVEVIERQVREALQYNQGYAMVRLGDGELVSLAHDVLIPTEEIRADARFQFLAYSGIHLPDHASRELLASKLLEADVIGVPLARYPTFQCLFHQIARHFHWPLHKMRLTNSNIQYELNDNTTLFHDILCDCKVLLIGNRMQEGFEWFKQLGYNSIVGSIPVSGMASIPSVLQEAQQYDYDAALVSAGIPADIICVDLAKQNKVAIDFGHLMDRLLWGQAVIRRN